MPEPPRLRFPLAPDSSGVVHALYPGMAGGVSLCDQTGAWTPVDLTETVDGIECPECQEAAILILGMALR